MAWPATASTSTAFDGGRASPGGLETVTSGARAQVQHPQPVQGRPGGEEPVNGRSEIIAPERRAVRRVVMTVPPGAWRHAGRGNR